MPPPAACGAKRYTASNMSKKTEINVVGKKLLVTE